MSAQIVLETVRRAVSPVVRRIIRVATRNGRSVARPDGGTADRGIVGSLEDLRRLPSRSAIVSRLRSMIVQTLQSGRISRSIRVIIVARDGREVDRSWSDGRRSVITGGDVVARQRHDGIGVWSSAEKVFFFFY